MEPPKDPISVPNLCEWCCGAGTSRCGRCHVAYYCSREHQMLHWSEHKKVCKKSLPPVMPVVSNFDQPSAPTSSFPSSSNWNQSNVPCTPSQDINALTMLGSVYNLDTPQNLANFNIPSEDDMMSSFNTELLSSDNNFWSLIDTCATQNFSDLDQYLGRESDNNQAVPRLSNQPPSPIVSSPNIDPYPSGVQDMNLMECAPLSDICRNVIHDLNNFGICVLDRFIGTRCGGEILEEVQRLYQSGIFRNGQIINPKPSTPDESVRTDVMTWVDGTEPDCRHIGNLIKKLDLVVTTCNKMPNNGQLSKYKLHKRTKAMVACYPGNGTHYKKHIDNPCKDGRCITCIYYLNKDWDVRKHGGLLRMFPSVRNSDVAQIAPIFDRMIFFWSDKRNPHEVLPAYATRFAITVWYFDADEREEALRISKLKKTQMQGTSF